MAISLKKQKIIGWVTIAVFIAMALCAIIGNIVNFGFNIASIFNLFPILLICAIVCLIAYFSIVKNTFAAAAKAQNEQVFKFNLKNFLLGLLILLVCVGASSPLFIFASKEINKTHSSNYVKTEAIVTYIDYGDSMGLKYLYFDEDGNEVISNNGASFGGINFKQGKTVTIYYNKHNPEIIVDLGTTTLELCGALFFVLGGIIAFLGIIGLPKFIPIIFCLTFMLFSGGLIAGTMLSSGLNLWEVYTGGGLGFACSLFFLIGFALLIPSVIDFVKIVINSVKTKKEKKQNLETIKALEGDFSSKYNYFSENNDNKTEKEKVKKTTKTTRKQPRKKYKHRFCAQALILIIVGLVFDSAGGLMFYQGVKSAVEASHYEKCEAVVTDIRTWEKDGDLLGSAIYTYFVDGVEYTQEAEYSQSAELLPEIGTKTTIRYNKNDPTIIKVGGWIDSIIIVVSLIPIGVSIGLFVFSWIVMRNSTKN